MNEPMIRQWYDVFKNNNQLTEIRLFGNVSNKTYSGYFTDIETLLNAIRPYDNYNIYFTLNAINDACYSRAQKDKLIQNAKPNTGDKEIVGRDWILIDIDCEKPSDTNSTDEEKELAKVVVNNVYKYLRDEGFSRPVVADSGNGFHLLYKVSMVANDDNTKIIKDFLGVLNMLFSTDKVKVDLTNYNNSRICKLYGCFNRKGSDSNKERPQRESKILRVPDNIQVTDNSYFIKVANILPKKEAPSRSNNYSNEKFDIDAFISKHNIAIRNVSRSSGFTKYVLENCPFDSSHAAPDSALFVMDSGGIAFKCLHNSCSQYTWSDFRTHYEPDAYDRKTYNEYKHKRMYYGQMQKETFKPIEENEEKGKKWMSMRDIEYVDLSKLVFIPTGYVELDKKIMGLLLGDISIISGLSGTGKTSWIDCILLNVAQRGFKSAVWSGELQDFRFQGWISQIAAGRNYVVKKDGYDNIYYSPKHITEQINIWLDDKLLLYNNKYGSKWEQLFADVKDVVETKGVSLVILDNLMALQIDGYEGDKYSKQTQFINDLKEYAKAKNIHIVLVCHPRKETGFLRKESINGTADLTNLCDNLFIIHRVGKDFETRAGEFLGKDNVAPYLGFDSVVEVCKNRSNGVIDYIVGMYYEKETRRLKNEQAEHIVYGWQELDMPRFTPLNVGEVCSMIPKKSDTNSNLPFEPNNNEELPF